MTEREVINSFAIPPKGESGFESIIPEVHCPESFSLYLAKSFDLSSQAVAFSEVIVLVKEYKIYLPQVVVDPRSSSPDNLLKNKILDRIFYRVYSILSIMNSLPNTYLSSNETTQKVLINKL